MPLPDLRRRDATAIELMDAPDADPDALAATYRRFAVVNRLLSGWRGLYRDRIRDTVRGRDVRILDIGSGGGDVARSLSAWCSRDARRYAVIAADADARATAWAQAQGSSDAVSYTTATSTVLRQQAERFDVIVSNHLLHHLTAPELEVLLDDSRALLRPGGVALHNDIARGRAAYALFAAATRPFARNLLGGTFIRVDGLTSIRRSYTPEELRVLAPSGWRVHTAAPFRVLLESRAP